MAKQKIVVTLYMNELFYDVQNTTFLASRQKSEAGEDFKAHMIANDDPESENQLLRSIGNSYGTLKTMLSEYIDENGCTGNNVLMSREANIIVTLMMPSNFNRSSVKAISTGLHKYIVNSTIASWYVSTNPSDAQTFMAYANDNLKEVFEAINKRSRPRRACYAPVFTPVKRTFAGDIYTPQATLFGGEPIEVSARTATEGAAIHWEAVPAANVTAEQQYDGSVKFTITGSVILQAWASHPSLEDSDVTVEEFTQVEAPVITPADGSFETQVQVTMASNIAGADIYYTNDGTSEPTPASTKYVAPLTITANTTFKAIAVKDGCISNVTTKTYTKTN